MTEHVAVQVDRDREGSRLDTLVASSSRDVSRTLAQELIRGGKVLVNGRPARPSYRVTQGDVIDVEVIRRPALSAEPEDIPLKVVYRDDDMAVIDKPAGLVVHPAAGHASGTLANALASLFPESRDVGPVTRPGIVHRLDKNTSGLMVVALRPSAYQSLQSQIAGRTAQRRYLALASGRVEPREGAIDAPVGRNPVDRKRMSVHGIGAREARTSYRVLEYIDGFTLLEARLHSGRTHQIRVHFAATGHPLAGDRVYGGPELRGLHRQFLHAYRLGLDSPSTGHRLEFESPLPPDLESVLEGLRPPMDRGNGPADVMDSEDSISTNTLV